MEGIFNRPNNIRAKQIAYQADKAPVYLKGNGKIWFRAYLGLFAVSFIGSNFQLIQYIRGKAKKIGE
ncbi:uncharacterized protein L201_005234 [Kwoniella dendrophila CBS 6074]|uniref:Cytochrome c oxidase subunit 7c n=1 Tax=Kwoniella dendrophila CBS 6074 TaxID=1295534 RepID=A0AAX4JY12_9TREE